MEKKEKGLMANKRKNASFNYKESLEPASSFTPDLKTVGNIDENINTESAKEKEIDVPVDFEKFVKDLENDKSEDMRKKIEKMSIEFLNQNESFKKNNNSVMVDLSVIAYIDSLKKLYGLGGRGPLMKLILSKIVEDMTDKEAEFFFEILKNQYKTQTISKNKTRI